MAGAPAFDLTRFAHSCGLSPKELRAELARHAALLQTEEGDMIFHLLIGMGLLSQNLNELPRSRFVSLCQTNYQYCKAALSPA